MTDFLFRSATNIADAIRQKQISAVEIVQAYLEQIERVNPHINAVVQLVADRALDEAKAADRLTASGEPLPPLHGVPITLKDSIDTEGIVTTYGTVGRKEFIPEHDATVAKRLRQAGAIVLGKTNTPEFTLGGEIDNPVYGKTFNPYRLTHSPGSSSGGSAAILAAGGSALDMGSDTGGSIREPANMCGLAGLKPTAGRVSRMGHAVPFGCGVGDMLTTIGPLARSVDDLELSLKLIAGEDGIDYTVVPTAQTGWRDSADVDLASLRIAVYTDGGLGPIDPAIEATINRVAESFQDADATLTFTSPPALKRASRLHSWLTYAEQAKYLQELIRKAGTKPDEVGDNLMAILQTAQTADIPNMTTILAELDSVRTEMWRWMQSFDGILCPIEPYVAIPHGENLNLSTSKAKGWGHMSLYNHTGYPAGVVRAGTTADGLPVGVQIVARPWREDRVLALLRFIETEFGGYQKPTMSFAVKSSG